MTYKWLQRIINKSVTNQFLLNYATISYDKNYLKNISLPIFEQNEKLSITGIYILEISANMLHVWRLIKI